MKATEFVFTSKSEALGTVEEAVGRSLLKCVHPTAEFVSVSRDSKTEYWEVQRGRDVVVSRLTISWKDTDSGTDNTSVFLVTIWETAENELDADMLVELESDSSKTAATEGDKRKAERYMADWLFDVIDKTSCFMANPEEGYTERQSHPIDVADYHPDSSPFWR